MNGYLRQSTASQVRTIGPFVDSGDFVTLENGLTIANTDILIKKNGAASAAKNSGGATADGSGGFYHLTWDATDTASVGELSYSIKVAGALVSFGTYVVLEGAVYDALMAAGALGYVANAPVNVAQIEGADPTDTIRDAVVDDATRIDASALNAATGTTIPAILDDTDDIGVAGAGLTVLATAAELAKVPKSDSNVTWNATAAAQIQTEANDALVANNLDHLVLSAVDTNFATTVHADSVVGQLADNGAGFDRTTDSLEAIRDRGDAAWADSGTPPTAAVIADAVWDEATAGHTTSGTFGEQAKTDIDAILADTNELQTDWVDGGRLDVILDARSSQTSVDDLPTNAELATALGTADDAVLAQVALVKAKTDLIPADPADASDVAAAFALVDTDLTNIEADTQDIQSRLPAALTGAGNMKSDALAIDGDTTAADRLADHAKGALKVVIGVGSTTTAIVLNATTGINGGAPSATNDFYNGRVIVFLTGTLAGQATDISDYDGGTVTLTVTALTGAASAADTAVIV